MNKEKEIIMPFGKHKGKFLNDIPHGYLIWLYDRNKLYGEIKSYAEKNIPILTFQKKMKKTKIEISKKEP